MTNLSFFAHSQLILNELFGDRSYSSHCYNLHRSINSYISQYSTFHQWGVSQRLWFTRRTGLLESFENALIRGNNPLWCIFFMSCGLWLSSSKVWKVLLDFRCTRWVKARKPKDPTTFCACTISRHASLSLCRGERVWPRVAKATQHRTLETLGLPGK